MKIRVPEPAEGKLGDTRCHKARAVDMEALGLPKELVPDWKERFLRKFKEMLYVKCLKIVQHPFCPFRGGRYNQNGTLEIFM